MQARGSSSSSGPSLTPPTRNDKVNFRNTIHIFLIKTNRVLTSHVLGRVDRRPRGRVGGAHGAALCRSECAPNHIISCAAGDSEQNTMENITYFAPSPKPSKRPSNDDAPNVTLAAISGTKPSRTNLRVVRREAKPGHLRIPQRNHQMKIIKKALFFLTRIARAKIRVAEGQTKTLRFQT